MTMTDEAARFERHFRNVLGHFATGVSIVTAIAKDEPIGMTVQSFCSLSLSPPLILICPGVASTSWPRISAAGRLAVNLLGEGQSHLARQFARPGTDKYSGVAWMPGPRTGSPLLDGALAWLECEIESESPGGDHLIVVCRVLDLEARTDIRPLVFFQSGFRRIDNSAALGMARSVVLSVADLDSACRYYQEGLGLTLLSRDGNRWAMLTEGNLTIALASADLSLAGTMSVGFRVHDVRTALERAVKAGGTAVEPVAEYVTEVRAAFRDPDGNLFYIYSPLEG